MFLAAADAAAAVDPNQDEDEDDKDDDAWLVWLLLAETAVANRPKGSAPSHGQDDMVIVAWCFVYETRRFEPHHAVREHAPSESTSDTQLPMASRSFENFLSQNGCFGSLTRRAGQYCAL